ncbi:MAG: ribosome biogenesis GTPase Der [Alphaproteobacteria bacterium]
MAPFDTDAAWEVADEDSGPLRLAVVGRPNVGKSTLVNGLIGTERMVTGPEPGITRDAVPVDWDYGGRAVRLVDTAGLRRRANVTERLERLSVTETERAIRLAELVVLVVDATVMLERQDLAIARKVVEEGRALVIAANKWDLVDDPDGALSKLHDRLGTSLPQVKGIATVTLSALTGRNLDRLMAAVFKTYELWNTRIPTGELNRWLEALVSRHPPPAAAGRRLRLRYITQAKARPPTFILFTGRPQQVSASYLRYLENGLRDAFGLAGVPLRVILRAGRNPYVEGA